jgi:hypothetical protein
MAWYIMKTKDLIDVASGNGNHYFRCMIRPGDELYDGHSYLDGLYRNEGHEVPVYTNEGAKDEYKDGARCYDYKDDVAARLLAMKFASKREAELYIAQYNLRISGVQKLKIVEKK